MCYACGVELDITFNAKPARSQLYLLFVRHVMYQLIH